MNSKERILIMLCGEAFSGKSTLAKQLSESYEANVVGRDEIYFAIEQLLALGETPEEDDEELWNNMWPIVIQGVRNQLLTGNSVVVDDNLLYRRQRDDLRTIADKLDVRSVLVYLDISAAVLAERKEKNKTSKERHDVPSAWMIEDRQSFERPTEDERPIRYTNEMTPESLKEAVEARFTFA